MANDIVADAREAGVGVDDRPLGNVRARITPNPGDNTNIGTYEVDDEGKIHHYGPSGESLGTVSDKEARKALGLD